MSRRYSSRRARQERKKTIRVLLGLGLTTSAFAAIAGTIAWTWAPQIGNWTLSPQQDFAEYAKDGDSRGGRTWVPPEMPPVAPWGKYQPTETAGLTEPQSEESTIQVASVETKDNNSSGHGPVNYDGQHDGENGNFFGLFSPGNNNGQNNNGGGGGGGGGSWNGTFNSNPPGGGGGSGFPNYAGGPGNGPGGNPPGNGPKSFSHNPPPGGPGNPPPGGPGNPPGNNPGPDNKGGPGDGPTGGPGDGPTGGPGDGPSGGPGDGPSGGPGDGPTGGPGDDPTGGPGDGPAGGPGDGPGGHSPQHLVSLPEDPLAIPEPGTLAMLLGGLLGLGWTIRRRA